MTSSASIVLKRKKGYIKLEQNPNPHNIAPAYINTKLVKNKQVKLFTRPIRGWKLSESDTLKIDEIVKNIKK